MSFPQPKRPSSAELIRQHSKARVLDPSQKSSVVSISPMGLPTMSRAMTDNDAVEALVRKYR